MPQKDSFISDSFAPDKPKAAAPAHGVGESGNYTREMSGPEIAGNQFLNVLEGMGVDPSHPVVGTIKNFLGSLRETGGRIKENPVAETLGAIGDVALSPVKALSNVLSSDTTDEQKAQGAGQFLMSTPVAAAELAAPGLLKKALPSAAQAGTALDQIKTKVGNIPQDMTKASDIAARARELQLTGHGSMPSVATAVERRTVGPSALGAPPVTYAEGFDMASAASEMSASEKMAMKGQMPAQVKRLAGALREANREVAESAGLGAEYDAAIKEYHQAMQIKNAGEFIKKYGPRALAGGGILTLLAEKYLGR